MWLRAQATAVASIVAVVVLSRPATPMAPARTPGSGRMPLLASIGRASVATILTASFIAAVVPPAQASFPGADGLIAFSRTEGNRSSTLWNVNPATGRARRLTAIPAVGRCHSKAAGWLDLNPSYSASGRQLVFDHYDACESDYEDGVYAMHSDGSGRQLVLSADAFRGFFDAPDWVAWPSLAPTGRSLAVNTNTQETLITDFQRPVRENTRRLGPWPRYHFTASAPAWGVNGRLALGVGTAPRSQSGWGHIMTVAPNGTHLRLVTRSVRDSFPDWSPTARQIVFWRQSLETLTAGHMRGDVFVAQANGHGSRRPRRLTNGGQAFFPAWSPNDRYIAYVRATNWDSSNGGLWTRPAHGGTPRLVETDVRPERISWQPRPR
jgi:Tol biopolymer transport system component